MGISYYLKKMDMFGEEFHMEMNGEEKVKTTAGFVFTLMFYVSLVVAIWWFLSSFLDRTNAATTQLNININEEYTSHDVNNNGFFFFFLFRNGTQFISPSSLANYLTVSFVLSTYSRAAGSHFWDATSVVKTSVPAVPCANTRWYKETGKQLFYDHEETLFGAFAVCADSDAMSLNVSGGVLDNTYTYLSLVVAPSASATAIPIATLTSLYAHRMILQTINDDSNYYTPFYLYRDFKTSYFLSPGILKSVYLQLGQITSVSNGGIIGEQLRNSSGSYVFDDLVDTSLVNAATNPVMLVFTILASRIVTNTARTYTSVFSLISNIGGVIELVAFAILLLYSPYSNYVCMKNLTRFGIMQKAESTNLLENTGDPKDPESFDYKNLWPHRFINWGLKKPKNETLKKQAEYLKNSEKLAYERCDIYKIIKNMNDLIFFKNLFFTKAHRKLAPIVGISLMEERETGGEEANMSVAEAIELLDDNDGENAVQLEFSKFYKKVIESPNELTINEEDVAGK